VIIVSNETLADIDMDSRIKVVLSNIQLVNNHQTEHPNHKISDTKNKIIRNKVPQVNNPNFTTSNIFYL